MSIEDRLREALAEVDRIDPRPDLLRRVERGLAIDHAHRRRVRGWALAGAASLALAGVIVAAASSRTVFGLGVTPVAIVRAVEAAVLLVLVVALGPTLRRFGTILLADVFRLSPTTGQRFLDVLDVAYYLTFVGYTITGLGFQGLGRTLATTAVLRVSLDRIAGLLLLMGLLHAATIALLPLLGALHASTMRRHRRRERGRAAPPPSPVAERAERLIRRALWIAGGTLAAGALLLTGVMIGLVMAG